MNSLKSIVECFKSDERMLFDEYYTLTMNKKKVRRYELLKLILHNQDIGDSEACMALYGRDRHTAFSHLKKGLKEDLLVMLMMQPSSSFAGLPVNRSFLQVKVMTIQANYLINRGNSKEGMKLAYKAIKLAEKYEHYAELSVLYNLVIVNYVLMKGIDKYINLLNKRLKVIDLERKALLARYYQKQISLPGATKYKVDNEYLKNSKKALDELEKLFESCNSSQVGQAYHKGRIFYHHLKEDIVEATKAAEEMSTYISNNPVLRSKNNMGGIQMQLASFALFQSEFEKAAVNSELAYTNFEATPTNQILALELMFFSYFRLNRLDEAEKVMGIALQHKFLKTSSISGEKWLFFKASLQYKLNNMEESMRLLSIDTNLKEDRSGWYLGSRMLDLMCQVEVGNYDIFEIKLQAFRRLLQSIKAQASVRDQNIYQMFRALLKNKFDFTSTINKNIELFKMLKEGKGKNNWNPYGYEVICVHDWMVEKSKSKIFV